MLGISVLLSFLVARLSLRHAENLERQAGQHYTEVEQAKRELQQLSACRSMAVALEGESKDLEELRSGRVSRRLLGSPRLERLVRG